MSHGGQASGTVQDGAANRRLWPRVAADETVTGRQGVIRVFLSQSHLSGVSQPQFRRTLLVIPRKITKHPSKYRENFCPSRDNTGVISVRYQMHLCSGFVFKRRGSLAYENYFMGSSLADKKRLCNTAPEHGRQLHRTQILQPPGHVTAAVFRATKKKAA